MKKMIFLFVLVLSSIGMSAQTFEENGITYSVQSTSPYPTVSVTGCWDCTSDLVINGSVTHGGTEYRVVRIGNDNGWTNFRYCPFLITVGDLPYCTSIGESAFSGCVNLVSVGDLSACTSIGGNAFSECCNLTSSIDLSACTSIGGNAFSGCNLEVTLPATPPTLTGAIGDGGTTFLVPTDAVATYRAADGWKDVKMQIISKDATHTWDVEAPVLTSIGADQFENVITLKVSGNIDSDDIMYMRNKMTNLHHLDLSDANFVDSDKEYYSGYKTQKDCVSGFFDMTRLRSVELPTSAKQIGYSAFSNCPFLSTIQIPEGITYIGNYAFNGCSNLKAVAFPSTLKTISYNAFQYCSLVSVSLPEHLVGIYGWAFAWNLSLTELHIPSSVKSIGQSAFESCNNLKDIYTYTVQPININSNTFSSYAAATLHVPTQGYNDYYASPTWGQFPQLVAFNEPYKYFYITDDFVLLSGKRFDTPEGEDLDVSAHAGSSITIEGETNQPTGNIDIYDDGTMGASIIPNNNLTAKTVTFHLTVGASTWRFFCFPFRVKLSNVEAPGSYVFRRYNGSTRAQGNSGWESLPAATEYLEPGVGYIYQCNVAGTLKIKVELPDFSWATSSKTNTLTAYAASSDQNASWNFIGNPLTCYYDIDEMHYDAPLTVWNGSSYVAYRAGDDNYQLRPFEAFFVQKPNDSSVPTYDKDKRMGHNAAVDQHDRKAAAARMATPAKRDRQLLNLVLSNGEQQDQTRVVFNEKRTADYEQACDAAKFMSMELVPQLYTVEQQTQYAINERQQGSVQVGFVAPKAGTYTLRAERMDMPVVLKDALTGVSFDLTSGEYTFESEAGTFNQRFMLMPAATPTAVKSAVSVDTDIPAYTLDGRQLPQGKRAKGIVVEKGKKMLK